MRLIILVTVIVFVATGLAFGQSAKKNDAIEQEIRKLDAAQANAVLRGDLAALDKLWSEDFTVTNPFNVISKEKTSARARLPILHSSE